MKAIVSVLGRFHAFYLAQELYARDKLARLYTSYPRAQAERYGVPGKLVESSPLHEVFNRAAQRALPFDVRHLAHAAFEGHVARRLRPEADVFTGWSGSSLAALRAARELGMLAVVERGSTHIEHQRDVMRAEYDRLGVRGRMPHPRTVEKELAEYELADRIAVPTRFCARTFTERGVPPEKLIQVPYGVSLDTFRPPEKERDPRAFRIVQCGNVSFRKGAHLLVEAFRGLDVPGARLDFVGPIAREVEPFLADWRSDAIAFHGRVSQSELPRFYHRASVFAMASLEEGMAMVIAQAMATGLPVVATEASGAGELVRDDLEGYVVPAGDVDALRARLRAAYRVPEIRAEMGRSSAERVAGGFTWADYGRRIAAAYERALRERARGRKAG